MISAGLIKRARLSSPGPPLSASRAQEQHQIPRQRQEKSTSGVWMAASKICRPPPPDSKTTEAHPGGPEEDRQPLSGAHARRDLGHHQGGPAPELMAKRSTNMEPSVRDAAATAGRRAWGANDPEDQRLISKAPKRSELAASSGDVSTSSAHMSAALAQK